MPKVSVIIPVYNAAPFLHQCLDSIVHQTLTDIEIILVNDGSTDDSNNILNECSSKDNRISIINQENKGAGAARNSGLRLATGKYLSFLDADDFFEPEMLEKLYNKCEETGADIAIYKANSYDNQKGEIIGDLGWTSLAGIPDKPLFSYKDVERFYQCCSSVAWDKFFRKSFVDEYGIIFQEIRFCNDVYFVHTLLCLTKKITTLNEHFVIYRQNVPTSIFATSKNDPLCFYESIRATREKLKTLSHYHEIEKSYGNWTVGFCLFHLFFRKNSDSRAFTITYKALQDYIFDEMGAKDRNKDFFYEDYFYNQLQKIISTPLDDYFFESVLDRNSLQVECSNLLYERDRLREERNQLQGEKAHLQGELDYSQSEQNRLQQEIDRLQIECDKLCQERDTLLASWSFRLGRMFTWFPRKLRGLFRWLNKHR